VGTPLELFSNPANTFVAGFIGTPPMNLIDGRIKIEDGNVWVTFDGGLKFPVPEKNPPKTTDRTVIHNALNMIKRSSLESARRKSPRLKQVHPSRKNGSSREKFSLWNLWEMKPTSTWK
jgi:ABC-type sugar transport system ATPase subunit